MPAPAFEFTDRAVPIVQFGRSENRGLGNARWGSAQWGVSRWGARDWAPVWTDVTCEIHEITTDTGRGGATDRFRPGTAEIVASNVHGVSKMIWPPLPPPPTPFEFVPQPPVTHEEDLQAPNATTVISDGWSFSDDFQTAPPRWIFPADYATSGTYPTVPFLWGDGHVTPELYRSDPPDTAYEGHGVMQWSGHHPFGEIVECAVTLEDLEWAGEPVSGSPQCVVDLYAFGNNVDRAATCVRFTLTPVFGGDNTITYQVLELAADGSTVTAGTPTTPDAGLGDDAVFPAVELRVIFNSFAAEVDVYLDGDLIDAVGWSDWSAGDRIGFAVHYVEGEDVPGDSRDGPRVTMFEGPDFEDDFTRAPGSGWRVNRKYAAYGPMIVEGGAMRPPVDPIVGLGVGGRYEAIGTAQWVSDFEGDQFIEIDVSQLSWPDDVIDSDVWLILSAKGNPRDLRAVVAELVYLPDWDTDSSFVMWELVQYGPNGERVHDPAVWGESVGEIELAGIDGVFPDARWRLEADTAGEARLYLDGDLLGHAEFPAIPDGTRVGIFEWWGAGGTAAGSRRGQVTRIDRAAGGLREPLGTEELGTWVRIGVDHATLGERWFFTGFVDGIVPTYIPEHADAVRIECIDSLGEAGRAGVIDTWIPHRFAAAPTRIRQILNAAHWPKNLRRIGDDSTQMSRPGNGKAVDMLTRVAESCGGAVYGDPVSGDIVFKGTDWQGTAASLPPLAVLTNVNTDGDSELPRICPVGWELSKRRGDLLTRVRLSSETSETVDGDPIVKEWRSPEMEFIYGVELYEATVLAISAERINELAVRQLRVRGARDTPRVEAVLLDAATAVEALDLMTTATFTVPSKYRCSHHANDDLWAFNTNYLVTGVRHRIRPTQWTCRLALDLSAPFHETGGRWGRARWGVDHWGKTR